MSMPVESGRVTEASVQEGVDAVIADEYKTEIFSVFLWMVGGQFHPPIVGDPLQSIDDSEAGESDRGQVERRDDDDRDAACPEWD